jgi:hypothetical protein
MPVQQLENDNHSRLLGSSDSQGVEGSRPRRALIEAGPLRGSLRGRLTLAPDWDSDAVNDAIAADFGMTS